MGSAASALIGGKDKGKEEKHAPRVQSRKKESTNEKSKPIISAASPSASPSVSPSLALYQQQEHEQELVGPRTMFSFA
jgi:hypothetical protein